MSRQRPARHPPAPPARARAPLAALLAAAWLAATPAAGADTGLAGQRVVDVVEQLRAGGLNILYSSDLLTGELRVLREPAPGEDAVRLAEILAAHGLALSEVAPGTLAVVRGRAAAPPPAADPAPPAPLPLEAIVVTASRYSLAADLPNAHVFMTQSELESLPRTGEETLRAVERLPGTAGNGLAGLAHVRGGATDETSILLDGLPLHEPFHLRNVQGPVSLLSTHVIESVDIHLGGFTASAGDRMSGLIDVTTVRPAADRHHEIGLSLFHASGLAARRFDEGRGQWLLSARRSNLGELARLAEYDTARPRYFDAFGRVDHAWSGSTRATLQFLRSEDRIDVADATRGQASSAGYENTYLWATLGHDWSPRLRGRLSASWTELHSARSGTVAQPGQRSGSVEDRRRYSIFGLKADATHESGRWLHRFGADLRDASARYAYRSERTFEAALAHPGQAAGTLTRALSARPAGSHVALYATSRVQLGARLTVEAGLRWDDQSYNTATDPDHQFGPRLNLVYEWDDATRLRLALGRYQQFQDIHELEVEDGVDAFQRPQRADQAIVALERDLSPFLSLRVEAYQKRYARLRPRFENQFDPLDWLPEIAPDRIAIAPTSARAEGLEALLTLRNAGPWSGWLGYARSRATDRVDGSDVPRSWDQPHAVTAGVNWADHRWNLTLAALWRSGWPTTALSLAADGTVVAGPRNGARLPSYATLDLRASRRFDVARGELTAYLEVTNATSRRNPCCVNWSVAAGADGGPTLVTDYDHWLPLVPSLGVLWKF